MVFLVREREGAQKTILWSPFFGLQKSRNNHVLGVSGDQQNSVLSDS